MMPHLSPRSQFLSQLLNAFPPCLIAIGTFAFGERTGLLNNPPDPIANKIYVAASGALDEMVNLSRHKWAKYIMKSKYRKLRGGFEALMEYGMTLTNDIIAEIKAAAEEGRPLKKGIGKYKLSKQINECKLNMVLVHIKS